MDDHRGTTGRAHPLPRHARLPINHCNLPAVILGSLSFQRHPVALRLDGVQELHAALFESLDGVPNALERAAHFAAYMSSCFLLDHLDEAGFEPPSHGAGRDKADYLRMLRGWLFDANGQEAAVLKSWVQSRFGLLPRSHRGPLKDFSGALYEGFQIDRAKGLYNTNALESQLDLLFTYCQYELERQYPSETHRPLYRGVNRIDEHEVLAQPDRRRYVMLLNNLNSFTGSRERADEFGDYILEARIPLAKLLYMPGLVPGRLKGEEEYLVIGGLYEVTLNLL